MNPAIVLRVAEVCHEANRALCAAAGDRSHHAWAEAPDWQRESAVSGVMAIAGGQITAPHESHDSWMREKLSTGWAFGPTKDAEKKTHPCLVPYKELSIHDQAKDWIFFNIASTMLRQAGLLA